MQTNNPCELLTAAMPVGSGDWLGVITFISRPAFDFLVFALLLFFGVYIQNRLAGDRWESWRLRCVFIQRLLQHSLLRVEVAYLQFKLGYRRLGFRFFFCGHKSRHVAMTPNEKS